MTIEVTLKIHVSASSIGDGVRKIESIIENTKPAMGAYVVEIVKATEWKR